MKKLLSVLLALAMLLGCTAFAEGVDYVGLWTMTGMEAEGVTMDPLMLGLEMTMTLDADGTCTLTALGTSETGTWAATETGIAVTDEEGVVDAFVLIDGALVAEQDGAKVIFTYGEAVASEGPAVLSGVPMEAFEGQWMLTSVSMFGINMSAEDIGAYMAFVLSDGAGIYAETGDDGELLQLDVTYNVIEGLGAGTVLELIYTDETITEPIVLLSMNMLEDGSLYAAEDMDGLVVEFYFAHPVEEPAAE